MEHKKEGQELWQTVMDVIRKTRIKKGVTQSNLAGELGVTTSNYNRIEAGVTSIKLSYFFQLCAYLDVEADVIISEAIRGDVSEKGNDHIIYGNVAEIRKEADVWKEKYHDANTNFIMMRKYAATLEEKLDEQKKTRGLVQMAN